MQARRTALVVVAALGLFSVLLASGAAGAGPAPQASPHATLVRTDVFHPAPGGPQAGKPQPAAANCSPDGTVLAVPAFTGSRATPGTNLAHFNAATAPAGVAAVTDLQGAFDAWHGANAKAPTFTVTTAGPLVTKPTANRQTDLMFGRTSGNALAVTYTWRWSDGRYESDTIFSNSVPWADVPLTSDGCNKQFAKYDVRNIATHEFGHIYGLDHPANDRFATMYAYGYTGETLKDTPGLSDLNGIAQLYP